MNIAIFDGNKITPKEYRCWMKGKIYSILNNKVVYVPSYKKNIKGKSVSIPAHFKEINREHWTCCKDMLEEFLKEKYTIRINNEYKKNTQEEFNDSESSINISTETDRKNSKSQSRSFTKLSHFINIAKLLKDNPLYEDGLEVDYVNKNMNKKLRIPWKNFYIENSSALFYDDNTIRIKDFQPIVLSGKVIAFFKNLNMDRYTIQMESINKENGRISLYVHIRNNKKIKVEKNSTIVVYGAIRIYFKNKDNINNYYVNIEVSKLCNILVLDNIINYSSY